MTYIHPTEPVIRDFAARFSRDGADLRTVCRRLLTWFEGHVAYSRLNAPFWPLQRSDLDVLAMGAGTCGDYANLMVSVLTALGLDACYARVRRDCYGDAQDHICAAVREGERYILVDATQPYRKWWGFDCPHREFELLAPEQFEQRMKAEEAFWTQRAQAQGKPFAAGLLYAPWLHAARVRETDAVYEDVFFLLMLDRDLEPSLYAYCRHYTADAGFLPAMASLSGGRMRLCLSREPHEDLWDARQWREVPAEADSAELATLKRTFPQILETAEDILRQAGCRGLME